MTSSYIFDKIICLFGKYSSYLLQIKKIKLIRGKTFPVCSVMAVTDSDLLLVRVKEETKYWIQVMNRLTGDLINKIPSMCDHNLVRVNKYPRDQDYAIESCLACEEIYAHNINTGESFSVHKGSKIVRMCDGPAGTLLVVDGSDPDRLKIFKLKLDKTQHEAQLVFIQNMHYRSEQEPLRFCYAECHDILMCTVKDKKEDQGYEIKAARLGSETIVWRLFGSVDSLIIKPESMTFDSEGNAYIDDLQNNRILKINSLTGEILSILLLDGKDNEKKNLNIISMRWSNTEPNLTVRTRKHTSTYFVPK